MEEEMNSEASNVHSHQGSWCPLREGQHPGHQGPYYSDYLQLDILLDAQRCLSANVEGKPATAVHDEHLFIIVHQTHELWFKHIIHELDSIRNLFQRDDPLEEHDLFKVLHRSRRIPLMFLLLVDHIKILETMSPLDFMDFRKLLVPASGFQSYQFRMIENKLGLIRGSHHMSHQKLFRDQFKSEEAEWLMRSSQEPSLAQLVEYWLEEISDSRVNQDEFLKAYEEAVLSMFNETLREIERKTIEQPLSADIMRKDHQCSVRAFDSILNSKVHGELVIKGQRRLSYRAYISALMITLYRDEPVFHTLYQVLECLSEIDNALGDWRRAHVNMVQKIIGFRHGTGGSSGYYYLRSTLSDHYKIFADIKDLISYIIPRHYIPKLSMLTSGKLAIVNTS